MATFPDRAPYEAEAVRKRMNEETLRVRQPQVNPIDRGVTFLADWNEQHQVPLDIAIMKIGEEFGETVEAWLGVHGYNPRKGKHQEMDDVAKELCDVVITALVALKRLGYQPQTKVAERVIFVQRRIQSGGENG